MNVAIDIGYSNSTVAVSDQTHAPAVVPDANRGGAESTPSRVLISSDRAYAGVFAERSASYFPDCEDRAGFKRFLGSEQALLEVAGVPLSAENLVGVLLRKLRHDVELNVSKKLDACFLSVPGCFSHSQRHGLITAAEAVDIHVGGVVEDAVAASVMFARQSLIEEGDVYGVYGLGGGVFDFSVIAYSRASFHMIAKTGLSDLGGSEFDAMLSKLLANDVQQSLGRAALQGRRTDQVLQAAAARLKERYAQSVSNRVAEVLFLKNELLEISCDWRLFRAESRKILDVTHMLASRCLESIGLNFSDLARVFLMGGMSRAPFVQDYWREKLGETQQKLLLQHGASIVAKGTALYAQGSVTQGEAETGAFNVVQCTGYPLGLRKTSTGEFTKLLDASLPFPLSATVCISVGGLRSGNAEFEFDLCQQIPASSNFDIIGRLRIAPDGLNGPTKLEIMIESAKEGQYALRIRAESNGKRVPFDFKPASSKFTQGDALAFTRRVEINAI